MEAGVRIDKPTRSTVPAALAAVLTITEHFIAIISFG
jgi:hypothetical protein